MDYTQLTAARNAFTGNPGLCNLFKFVATETWKRLEFAYIRKERAPFETTLTQNLLFTIQSFADQYPQLSIQIQEAADESANGNDLELLLRFNQEKWEFYAPIQAKKISRRENYNTMDHGKQIELLLAYGRERNGLPLYLLFNTIDSLERSPLKFPEDLYGCTLISAHCLFQRFYNQRYGKKNGERVLKWNIPYFEELHDRFAIPWHQLVCGNETLKDFLTSAAYENLSAWYPDQQSTVGLVPLGSTFAFVSKIETPKEILYTPIDSDEQLPIARRFRDEDGRENSKTEEFNPLHRITINVN
jgi:hypothetical protein